MSNCNCRSAGECNHKPFSKEAAGEFKRLMAEKSKPDLLAGFKEVARWVSSVEKLLKSSGVNASGVDAVLLLCNASIAAEEARLAEAKPTYTPPKMLLDKCAVPCNCCPKPTPSKGGDLVELCEKALGDSLKTSSTYVYPTYERKDFEAALARAKEQRARIVSAMQHIEGMAQRLDLSGGADAVRGSIIDTAKAVRKQFE